jgi:hypothetical protein
LRDDAFLLLDAFFVVILRLADDAVVGERSFLFLVVLLATDDAVVLTGARFLLVVLLLRDDAFVGRDRAPRRSPRLRARRSAVPAPRPLRRRVLPPRTRA